MPIGKDCFTVAGFVVRLLLCLTYFLPTTAFYFVEADSQQCTTLKCILVGYELDSGQSINFDKSGIFFSFNVSQDNRRLLSDILGASNPLNTRKYLGLPSLLGRNKKAIFRYIRDRQVAIVEE